MTNSGLAAVMAMATMLLVAFLARPIRADSCVPCASAACNKEFLLPASDDKTCTLIGNIGLLSLVTTGEECTVYSQERLCTYFSTQSDWYSAHSCDTLAPKLCMDVCTTVANCLSQPSLLDCPTIAAGSSDTCLDMPPSPLPVPGNFSTELPPVNETRFTDAYDIAVLVGLSRNNFENGPITSLNRVQLALFEMAVDDINRSPDVLPHTKMRLQAYDSFADPAVIGRVLSKLLLPRLAMGVESGFASLSHLPFGSDRNSTNVVGVLGPVTSYTASVVQGFGRTAYIPMVCASAMENDQYPGDYLVQTMTTGNIEALAVLSIMKNFGWQRAALIFQPSVSAFPSHINTFMNQYNVTDIQQFAYYPPIGKLYPTLDAMKVILKEVIDKDYRVIIVRPVLGDIEIEPIMLAAEELGMLNGDYVFFGTSVVGILANTERSLRDRLYDGFFATQTPTPNHVRWPIVLRKILGRLATEPYFAFNASSNDGNELKNVDLTPAIPYFASAYEAPWVFARAIAELQKQKRAAGAANESFTGPELFEMMKANKYDGVSGRVEMSPVGFRYSSYDISTYDKTSGKFLKRAAWTQQTNAIAFESTGRGSEPMSFYRGVTSVPDRTVNKERALPSGIVAASYAIAGVGAAVALAVHGLLFKNRSKPSVKAANLLFCHLITFGTILGFAAIIAHAQETATTCWLFPLLASLSFDLVFGCLFVKNYQILKIFNSRIIQERKLSRGDLLSFVGMAVFVDGVVTVAWIVADMPARSWTTYPLEAHTVVSICKSTQPILWWLFYTLPKGGVLLAGAYISWQVRTVPDRYNETRYIFVAVYNFLLMCLIVLTLEELLGTQIDAIHIIFSVGIFFGMVATLLVIFIPKFLSEYFAAAAEASNNKYTINVTGQQHLGGQQQHGHAPGDSTLNGGGGGGAGGNNSALETPLTRGTYPVAGSAGVSQLPDGVGGGGSGAASGIASVAHGPGGSGSASPPGGAQGGGSGVAMSSLGPRSIRAGGSSHSGSTPKMGPAATEARMTPPGGSRSLQAPSQSRQPPPLPGALN